jgi:hypothetical protein
MPANMPDLTAMHMVSVEYACMFSGVTAQGGKVAFGSPPVQFKFLFETGTSQPDPQSDLETVSWDYSWFDQVQAEAGITAALSTICQALAGLLGLPVEQVQALVQIQRIWTVAPNTRGNAAPQVFSDGVTVTEIMPYPV